MRFGNFPISDAVGGILAHAVRLPDDTILKKGMIIEDEIADLMLAASMETVLAAIPEAGDLPEDEAAQRVAVKCAAPNIRLDVARTGRVNMFAEKSGVFLASSEHINAINAVDPAVTIATLADHTPVNAGRLVATVKIIPYAVAEKKIEQIENLDLSESMRLLGYRARKVALISTLLPGTKPSLLDKTKANLARRLAWSESEIVSEDRVFHLLDDILGAIRSAMDKADMIVLFGASAISDPHDLIPAAIEAAGGEIERFGMPVDPGNLLLLGSIGEKPVIGAPGCARSLANNGFDDVLSRLLADVPVTSNAIANMGVGGLRMETGARPHPRERKTLDADQQKVGAVILAAGQSRRMGDTNKMTLKVNGESMVNHAIKAAIKSGCETVVVVTGHEAEAVREVSEPLEVKYVHNPSFEVGLSTSLAAGVGELSGQVTHALILLGDMPLVDQGVVEKLLLQSRKNPNSIIVATASGKRGNPVIWPADCFDEMQAIEGDTGARHLIGMHEHRVIEVEIGEAAGLDLDTPASVKQFRGTDR